MKNKFIILIFFFSFFAKTIFSFAQNDSLYIVQELIQNREFPKALQSLNLLKKNFYSNNDTLNLLKIYDLYFEIYNKQNNIEQEKKTLLEKSLLLKSYIIKRKNDTSLQHKLFFTYQNLANLYENNREYNTAIDLYQRMLFIAKKSSDYKLQCLANSYIANTYSKTNNLQKAYKYFTFALKTARKSKDSLLVSQTITNIGDFFHNSQHFSQALNDYYYALNLADSYNSSYLKSIIYSKISKIFNELGYFDKALLYSQKALNEIKNIKTNKLNYSQKASFYLYTAQNYIALNNYSKALSTLLKAKKIISKTNNLELLAQTECLLGQTYTNLNNYINAKENLSSSLLIRQKLKNQNNIINCYLQFGYLYFKQNKIELAKYYFTKAFEISDKSQNYKKLLEASLMLYRIYKNSNNINLALKFHEKYSYALSMIQKQNETISVEKLEVEQQYRKQSAFRQQKLILLKKDKQKLTLLLIGLSAIFIIVVILAFLFIRKNKIINRQKNLIEKQKAIIFKQYEKYKLLSLVASHTQNSIFIMDTQGKILYINDALLKLYKTSHYEIFTKNNGDYKKLTKYDIDKIFSTCIKQKKSLNLISEFTIDNKKKYIQTTISPIVENQTVTKLIGIESDITELKIAELEIKKQKKDIEFKNKLMEIYNQELKQQKEAIVAQNEELQQQQEELQTHMELLEEYNKELSRLSVIAEETDNVIYIFDLTGKLIWVNDAFTRHTGFTLPEFIDQRGDNIIMASTVPNIEYYFFSCIEQKKSVTYISEFTSKFGKKMWLQTTLSPIKDDDGNVKEIVAIDSNITEIKMAEQKISQQNLEIKSSLEYASLIQRSVLPLKIFFDAVFEKNFIYNRPRDIVSGDFYFLHYNNDKCVFALADCTGHGIPGAFMSLLGTMALKLIMSKINNYNPNIILNMLNDELIKLLHQRGKRTDTIDSIDMALCVFDFKSNTMDYSGANIPLFIARKNKNNYTINRVKPTKATIGFDMLREAFTVNSFTLNKGDRIYLSSDGIADQFGGKFNKKLKRKGFIELLNKLTLLPIDEQENELDSFLQEWMGANEQIDDMLLIGIEY